MARRLTTAVLAVIFMGTLASCASGATGPGAAAGGGSTVPTGPAGSAPGGASPSSGTTIGPPLTKPPATEPGGTRSGPAAGQLTLTGRVEEGVEPGCLILRSGGQTYELMSGDRSVVHAGAQVVVTGYLATGMMSHCMQGQLFQVTSARPG